MELVRCRHEIAGIEAELHAGNPDILGLLLAYADWRAELRILQNEVGQAGSNRRSDAESQPENRATGTGYLATA